MNNFVLPFIFNNSEIRGRFVYFGDLINDCFNNHNYPAIIKNILAKSLMFNSIMGSLVKLDAIITLQIQKHDNLLKLLVSELFQEKFIRAYGLYDERLNEASIDFDTLCDGSLFSITIDPIDKGLSRYQGIVELNHKNLDAAFEEYFYQSEQISTKIKAFVKVTNNNGKYSYEAACLMIQKLPESKIVQYEVEDPWDRIGIFFDTVSDDDLFKIANDYKSYLPKIFAEDEIIAFEPKEFFYRCRCSYEKIQNIITEMKIDPSKDMEAKCECCGTIYNNISTKN